MQSDAGCCKNRSNKYNMKLCVKFMFHKVMLYLELVLLSNNNDCRNLLIHEYKNSSKEGRKHSEQSCPYWVIVKWCNDPATIIQSWLEFTWHLHKKSVLFVFLCIGTNILTVRKCYVMQLSALRYDTVRKAHVILRQSCRAQKLGSTGEQTIKTN